MYRIVVTDLTSLSDEKICLAGLDIYSGTCFRPLDYLTHAECHKLDIKQGSLIQLNGFFQKKKVHSEDFTKTFFSVIGKDYNLLYKALRKTAVPSIASGFGKKAYARFLEEDDRIKCSIITLKLKSSMIEAIVDYEKSKIRINIDSRYDNLHFLPYGSLNPQIDNLEEKAQYINKYINNHSNYKDFIYARIGLTRAYEGKCWMQVNAIYGEKNV